MVSIILPTYNGSMYIKQSIDSILRQTYKNIELIVVNDSSTDDTLEIIKRYAEKDSRIRIVNNQVNKGLPVSLNIGFSVAKGRYLTWTSDDNYYDDNAIEIMVDALNKGVDFVYAKCYVIDSQGKKIRVSSTDVPDKLKLNNCVWACFMYTRKVYTKVGRYNPCYRLIEDYDYWLRIHELGFEMQYLDQFLYYYRIHNKSLTMLKRNDVLRIEKKLRMHYLLTPRGLNKNETQLYFREFIYSIYGLRRVTKELHQKDYYFYKIISDVAGELFYMIFKEKVCENDE